MNSESGLFNNIHYINIYFGYLFFLIWYQIEYTVKKSIQPLGNNYNNIDHFSGLYLKDWAIICKDHTRSAEARNNLTSSYKLGHYFDLR